MARLIISDGDAGSDTRALLNALLQRAVIVMEPVDLSGNAFPSSGGSGGGAPCENDEFPVAVPGSPAGTYIDVGLRLRAKVDNPGQDITKWTWY